VTETNRPPLPADQLTGLRVAGFDVVSKEESREWARMLGAQADRADRAEGRVRLAGDAFASLADLVEEALELHADGWNVKYLVGRVERVREQLRHQAAFFAEMPEVEQ